MLEHPTELLDIFFDRMPMGIAIFDRELVLRRCNPTWAGFVARYTETSSDEVLPGRYFFDLAPGTEEATMPLFERVLAGETVYMEALRLQSGGGPLSYWDAVFTPLVERGRVVGLIDVVIDATERVRAYEQLERRVESLTGIAANLTVERPMEDILNTLAASVVEASAAEACLVTLIDGSSDALSMAGSYGLPDGLGKALEASWRNGAKSPVLYAFHYREPRFFRDARRMLLDDPLYAPAHTLLRETPLEAAFILPLVIGGRTLGAISVYYLPDSEPTEDERTFLGAIADQAAVVVENARLYERAQSVAALEERQRLARELHDSVSQALYGITLGSDAALTLLERDPAQVREPLEYVRSLAEAGLAEMRGLIFELRPESLENEGLIAALERQVASLRARHEIEVQADLCSEPDVPLGVKEALYRVAQETLNNTVKHARASSVEVKLDCGANGVTLWVSDDGVGFDPTGEFPGHLGLKSMRERTERLGGTLEVTSEPRKGTHLRAWIPPHRQ